MRRGNHVDMNSSMHSHKIFIDLSLLKNSSVHDFKTVLLAYLVTFGANFDTSFWDNPLCPHIPVWDIEKEACLHRENLWNWSHWD